MRHLLPWLLVLCPLSLWAGEPKETVADFLQKISVTISTGQATGSGTAFSRDGQTFIWTAGHVVDDLRHTREVVDSRTGGKRTVIEFDNPKIVQRLIEGGKTVGRLEMDAEVLHYSDIENGQDLALLRVIKKNFIPFSARFYLEKGTPPIGSTLYHVGSRLGEFGSNSMTSGIMSQHGRLIGKKEYDECDASVFPGSSGGGVYLQDGRYVGMITRGAVGGFSLMVPIRRIKSWAEKEKLLWALDPAVPLPSAAELEKLPLEDSSGPAAGSNRGDRGTAKAIMTQQELNQWLLKDSGQSLLLHFRGRVLPAGAYDPRP